MTAGDELTGRTLGDFVVRERLAEGGFGAVYRAKQVLLGREAVIKVLHTQLRRSNTAIERFLREAKLASKIDHPYAAHIYAFGVEKDGLLWIAMELVDGTPLDERLARDGPIPLEQLLPLLERLCEVIETAHERGIVHRDIKPSNVMVLSRAGRLLPKLLDLGIAKLVEEPLAAAETVERPPAAQIDDKTDDKIDDKTDDEVDATDVTAADIDGDATVRAVTVASGSASPSTPSKVLTRDGAMVGSPPYMAPEQWIDSSSVDARTDQYALAVLTYEALTGRRPFLGKTLAEMLEAHTTAPMPPLGDDLPAELDAVLARALAKQPSERYDSLLDFAAALREASGLSPAVEPPPRLDEALSQTWSTRGPQPLAECVLDLEAARNVHQARDALWTAVEATVRYLAALAIACRTKTGDGDDEAVAELLVRMHRRRFSSAEWLELARALVRPFRDRPQTYPIPELALLFEPDKPLARMVSERPEHGTEKELRARLIRWNERFAAVLSSLAFALEYPLAVGRGGEVEGWMGGRKLRRPALAVAGRPVDDGVVVLLDRERRPLLLLSPVVQVAPPAPGAADEVFLLDGRGPRGARLVSFPVGFERHDDALWQWLADRFLGDDRGVSAETADLAPYRGLEPFGPSDAAMFFGRERETDAFVNRMRIRPLLAIVGPSGAGKSSFVQAGVLPALETMEGGFGPGSWRVITVRPGASPIAALEAKLQIRIGGDAQALGVHLRSESEDAPIVLVIDQLEELFTLCKDESERELYAASLVGAARTAEDPVRVIVTLRDDFLAAADRLPALRERLTLGLQLLTTPARDDLMRILVEPLRRIGYELSDSELAAEMVDAVAGKPGALALLSFTASKLWERRDRHFRQITREAYEELGGVGGALANHADGVLEQMVPGERRATREAFRHLVTAEGTRAVLGREQLEQAIGSPHAGAVIEALIAARLVVASETEEIEIVHEALLDAWPQLVTWRLEDAEGARMRDQLRAAARQWDDRDRPKGLLWRGDALTELQLWRARHTGGLTAAEEAFAAASAADAARGVRLKRNLVIASLVSLAVVAAVLLMLMTRARRNERRAQRNEQRANALVLEQYAERGRLAALADDPIRALVFLDAAYAGGVRGPAIEYLIARASREVRSQRATLDHDGWVFHASFRPDGSAFVTCGQGGALRLWDRSGALLATLEGHTDNVVACEVSRDGRTIMSASRDGTARLWSADGAPIAVLSGHEGALFHAALAPSSERVATAGRDNTARVFTVPGGELVATLTGHQRPLQDVAFSPDSQRVVSAARDKTARIWEASTGRLLATLTGHQDRLSNAMFSPDGRRVVTSSWDDTARIWDADSGQELAVLRHDADVNWAQYSPDGAVIVTGSADATVRIWDAASGAQKQVLRGHTGAVTRTEISPDGSLLISVSRDGTAKIWERRTGRLVRTLFGHLGQLWDAAISSDGELVVTTSFDHTAKLWELRRSDRGLSFDAGAAVVTSLGFDPEGGRLVTASEDGVARIWDAAGGRLLRSLEGHGEPLSSVEFSPDGRLVATAGADGTARVWSAATGELRKTYRHDDRVFDARFSPDSKRLVTTSLDTSATIRDLAGAPAIVLRHPTPVLNAEFVPDGSRVVTSSWDGAVRAWDAASGKPVELFGPDGPNAAIARLSDDGRRLATIGVRSGMVAFIWAMDTRRMVASLEGHGDEVIAATFDPGGVLVATASSDRTVRLWDVERGRLLDVFWLEAAANDVAFDRRGHLAVAAGPRVELWPLPGSAPEPAALSELVRCRIPLRLSRDGESIEHVNEPPDDCDEGR